MRLEDIDRSWKKDAKNQPLVGFELGSQAGKPNVLTN